MLACVYMYTGPVEALYDYSGVRPNLTLTIQLNAWVVGNSTTLHILFLSVILQCYKSNRFKNHTAILFITKLFA